MEIGVTLQDKWPVFFQQVNVRKKEREKYIQKMKPVYLDGCL